MRNFIVSLWLFIFLVAGCSGFANEQPESVLSKVATNAGSVLVRPSPTFEKYTEVVKTPTLQPTPTLFPLFETPPASADQFQLKQWATKDAEDALQEGEWAVEQSLENWENFPSRYYSNDFSQYLFTLERETLLRYPDSPNSEELLWKISYGEATFLDETGKIDGFVKLVENATNDKNGLLPDLNILLNTNKFEVSTNFPIENLFGDGISAKVIEIETDRFTSALFVTRSQGGYNNWIPVWEHWAGKGQTNYIFSAEDLNGNGIQEIMVMVNSFGAGNPGSCARALELFEWNSTEERFINLASNIGLLIMSSANGECERPWEFVQAADDDSKMIVSYRRLYNESDTDCQLYEEWKRYRWNGTAYEWDQSGIVPYEGVYVDLCAIGWANVAGAGSDQAVQILASALTNWKDEFNEIWGPASEDFFRYKLGTWYALRGQTGLAKSLLLSVRDHTGNPQFNFAPRVAEIYLTNYELGGVTQACETMFPILLEEFSNIPNDGFRLIAEEMKERWGFIVVPSWKSPTLNDFCESEMPDIRLPPAPPYIDDSPLATQRKAIEYLEHMLFQNQDFSMAKMLIQNLLGGGIIENRAPDEPERIKPYLQYLLGLTYEMSGMEDEAIKTYWQLWKEYPDNPYTLIIRRKLVLIQ